MAIGKSFVMLAGALLASGRMLESSGSCSIPTQCFDSIPSIPMQCNDECACTPMQCIDVNEEFICSTVSHSFAMLTTESQCHGCHYYPNGEYWRDGEALDCRLTASGRLTGTGIVLRRLDSGQVECWSWNNTTSLETIVDCNDDQEDTSSTPASFTTSEEHEISKSSGSCSIPTQCFDSIPSIPMQCNDECTCTPMQCIEANEEFICSAGSHSDAMKSTAYQCDGCHYYHEGEYFRDGEALDCRLTASGRLTGSGIALRRLVSGQVA